MVELMRIVGEFNYMLSWPIKDEERYHILTNENRNDIHRLPIQYNCRIKYIRGVWPFDIEC